MNNLERILGLGFHHGVQRISVLIVPPKRPRSGGSARLARKRCATLVDYGIRNRKSCHPNIDRLQVQLSIFGSTQIIIGKQRKCDVDFRFLFYFLLLLLFLFSFLFI